MWKILYIWIIDERVRTQTVKSTKMNKMVRSVENWEELGRVVIFWCGTLKGVRICCGTHCFQDKVEVTPKQH